MPIGRFRDFDDCVEQMIKNGRGHKESMNICGALQRDIEGDQSQEDGSGHEIENTDHGAGGKSSHLPGQKNKFKKKKNKEMEEITYSEPNGIVNYELEELKDERGKQV